MHSQPCSLRALPGLHRLDDVVNAGGLNTYYTTFAYSDLALAQARVPIDGSEDIALAFTVHNTGGRRGGAVVRARPPRQRGAAAARTEGLPAARAGAGVVRPDGRPVECLHAADGAG